MLFTIECLLCIAVDIYSGGAAGLALEIRSDSLRAIIYSNGRKAEHDLVGWCNSLFVEKHDVLLVDVLVLARSVLLWKLCACTASTTSLAVFLWSII